VGETYEEADGIVIERGRWFMVAMGMGMVNTDGCALITSYSLSFLIEIPEQIHPSRVLLRLLPAAILSKAVYQDCELQSISTPPSLSSQSSNTPSLSLLSS
jgi:hypothetical protein